MDTGVRHALRLPMLASVVVLLLMISGPAFSLEGENHRTVTQTAITVLHRVDEAAWNWYAGNPGVFTSVQTPVCIEIRTIRLRPWEFWASPPAQQLIEEAGWVDYYNDVEFVDVEGTGRDNPHVDEWDAIDDIPHHEYGGRNFTAFNHFIDIRKGPGYFDDYDGYSYAYGSARRDEYQDASDALSGAEAFFADLAGFKIDEGIAWWFNDEYVDLPCYSWYRDCSPAVERYSYPGDKGIYATVIDELKARFPQAESTGQTGMGIPYSVFMPVDNMARYWFDRFVETRDILALAPVMHAIQDASVPHHASGCMGNWHGEYERDIKPLIEIWVTEDAFLIETTALVESWNRVDPDPPTHLEVSDWSKTPAINWRIDQLVTWVALNAYREYESTYGNFGGGYSFNEPSARELTKLATAMSTLVLLKGYPRVPPELRIERPILEREPIRPPIPLPSE
jgi:hypothetical protein